MSLAHFLLISCLYDAFMSICFRQTGGISTIDEFASRIGKSVILIVMWALIASITVATLTVPRTQILACVYHILVVVVVLVIVY